MACRAWVATVVGLAAAGAACSEPAATSGSAAAADGQADVDAGALGNGDGTVSAETALVPLPFGATCSAAGDCEPPLCLPTAAGRACAVVCGGDRPCPNGQQCIVIGTGSDVQAYCVDRGAYLCQPCTADAQCNGPGVEGGRCVDYGKTGRFCGTACDGACPGGYFCAAIGDGQQCVRVNGNPNGIGFGTCPCSKLAVQQQAATACQAVQPKVPGQPQQVCDGMRVCTPTGLSACATTTACKDLGWQGEPDGTPCDDGDECTAQDRWLKGVCHGDDLKCACKTDVQCAAFEDGNLCNGTLYCDLAVLPHACKVDPKSAIQCNTANDTACSQNHCSPLTGQCSPVALPEGTTCSDANLCTAGDVCSKGLCQPGANLCQCLDDAGCPDDADQCNGVPYCDKSKLPWTCQTNPKSVVQCATNGNLCAPNSCNPATGQCAPKPQPDGKTCPGEPDKCHPNWQCAAAECQPTVDLCCTKDADCAKNEDGDLCNGTLFCNLAKGLCEVNPATVVKCPTVDDTACRKNQCQPKTGACVLVPVANGTPGCDDGNPCTGGDHCQQGACVGSANGVCGCQKDADCGKFEDGDACNGKLYCDKGKAQCVLNPATIVHCKASDDTDCLKTKCVKATGQCQALPLPNGVTCDADGTACTAFDQCGNGVCKAGANLCECQTDADCAKKEDGNLCNGTLYCDLGVHQCKVNPASVVVCPSGDDTACSKNQCQPKTGACVATALKQGSACDDGNPCTVSDACVAGECTAGPNLCACAAEADCGKYDDGDPCNGALYCKKAVFPWVCAVNPGTVVQCQPGTAACVVNACEPKTGTCKPMAANKGAACDDGDPCTAAAVCADGACMGAVSGALVGAAELGGEGSEAFHAVVALPDGLALAGMTMSKGKGSSDMWLVRLDETGQVAWDKTYGGAFDDQARALLALPDGFLVVGMTAPDQNGPWNGRVLRTDAAGTIAWDKQFGGAGADVLHAATAMAAGGLAVAGGSESGAVGSDDGWLVRLDAQGQALWSAKYGGGKSDVFQGVIDTGDGLALVGYTASLGAGNLDLWLVRTDASGKEVWQRTYGGAAEDTGAALAAHGGGYVLAGHTKSKGAGIADAWLVRVDSAGSVVWDRTYGGKGFDAARAVVALPNGHLVWAGSTDATGSGADDAWLVQTDAQGEPQWQQKHGGPKGDQALALAERPGGWVLAGLANQAQGSQEQGFVVRTDPWGNSTCTAAGSCAVKPVQSCDDQNPCTADTCSKGQCQHAPLANGLPCEGTATCAVAETCQQGQCQGGVAAAGPTTATMGLDPDKDQPLLGVIAASGGGWWAVGQRLSFGKGAQAWLLRIAEDGKVAAEHEYGDDKPQWLFDAVELPGGDLLLVGEHKPATYDGYLLRVSPGGKVVWEKTAAAGVADDALYDVALTQAGVAFAVGVGTANGAQCWLQRIELDGILVAKPTLVAGDCKALAALGHGLVAAGGQGGHGLLVRYDGAGGIVWQKGYGTAGGDRFDAVLALPDGSIVAGGVGDSEAPGKQDGWLVKFDGSGHLLWHRNAGVDNVAFVYDLALLGGDIVATGWQPGAKGNELLFWRVDPAGNPVVWASLPGPMSWRGNGIAAGANGVIVVGTHGLKGETEGRAMAVRLDAWGHVACAEAGPCADLAAFSCGDGNPCTADTCTAKSGCVNTKLADESACDDGDPCTAGDACTGSACKPLGPKLFSLAAGDTLDDFGNAVAALPDGGLAVVGAFASGGALQQGAGQLDVWLLRVNAAGAVVWSKTYGGGEHADVGLGISALSDGFVVAGHTYSKGAGGSDGWLLRTDADGKALWDATYGGNKADHFVGLAAAGGALVAAGWTTSSGAGGADAWIVRVDLAGKQEWAKTFGGAATDALKSVVAVGEGGGVAAVGNTSSKGGGGNDVWLLRVDAAGTLLWDKTFGGPPDDYGDAIVALADGGFAVAGEVTSKGSGSWDFWLIRLGPDGTLLWDRTYGGTGNDAAHALAVLSDGFALTGHTYSKGAGKGDAWLVRTDVLGNPLWDRTLGGAAEDDGHALVTVAGGFALAGITQSQGAGGYDAWLVRTDAWGNATCTACAGLTTFACDDADAKTLDLCDPQKGCVHLPQ